MLKHSIGAGVGPLAVVISLVILAGLTSCAQPGMEKPKATPDVEYAMRWWNVLNAEQMVAALYGDQATPTQATAAKKMYAQLDDATKANVNAAAAEIYGDGGYTSVGQWWETLDCRKMRIAAGDGNTADPMSPYCRHYPGSDFPPDKILEGPALAHVNKVGMALLGRSDPGVYPPLPLLPSLPSLQGTWSTAGPPMVTLTVDAAYSFSLTLSPPDLVIVYSGTIAVTATALTATITAVTTNGVEMPAAPPISGPHEFSYSVDVTDTGATLTVMGDALQVL
ncbi:MAG: hypothetical protein OYL41_10755, partial [Acidobacteriota bacterium]|nr:hypothetical protein [Acidobacteriota bacterium]